MEVRRPADESLLDNAAREAAARRLDAFPIVDADCHQFEMESWAEIARRVEHPVIRRRALGSIGKRAGQYSLVSPQQGGDQFVAERLKRPRPPRSQLDPDVPGDVALLRHSMRHMAIDYAVLFPTTMLSLGLHPHVEVEVAVARAYARWITEEITPRDPTIKTMLYLPFNDPDASLRLVQDFADRPGVVGFMVTSVRYQPVHDNRYMKVYAAIEERGLPLAFHPGNAWRERSIELFNRFLSVHTVGFPLFNIIHLTNMVVNGIPERFPRLKLIWMEAGVVWIPFLMYRLDSEYAMRPSEAPQLRRLPSEYMRDFFYTTQPMETTDSAEHLEAVFDMIHGETQLLYASDYPHWDFDLPSRVYDLPFLSEAAKRRILGGNAMQLFGLGERAGAG